MTDRKIEELAADVLLEIGADYKDFSIDRVEEKDRHTLHIIFSWKKPFRVQIAIDLSSGDSDESVKAEIRRQLEAEKRL